MKTLFTAIVLVCTTLLLIPPRNAAGHCDALDGPVVADARVALKTGDVTPVLKWITKDREKELREVFANVIQVRGLSHSARDIADRHFFETVVRFHRAGEGEPFTGLKPVGMIESQLKQADTALLEGSISKFSDTLIKSVQTGLHERFHEVLEKKKRANESVEAGRAYVAAYVEYTHYVEAIHVLGSQGIQGQHAAHATRGHGVKAETDRHEHTSSPRANP